MIFLGDVAHPFSTPPDWSALGAVVGGKPVVANLEGAFVNSTEGLRERKLFNHISVVTTLEAVDVKVLCLANNHITDVERGVQVTRRILAENNMLAVGAGTPEEAASPVFMTCGDREYAFLAFGWSTIECVPARSGRAGVNPLKPSTVLRAIRRLREQRPSTVIVAMFHWNMELERYPQPAHRQLAFAAIDAGANAIIGHHPHCVGGFEIYKGCPVAYSLGDWWIPQGVFLNGALEFPDYTLRQVALEWEFGKSTVLHWFNYSREGHGIEYDYSETLIDALDIPDHTPFWRQSREEYERWFRRNRVKRKALPVYYDYRSASTNWIRDVYIRGRQPLVVAARTMLRGRGNR